jgi:catechol 2,3-dioxygenase-like lactoylglutathione lyase family enzyme
MDGIDHVVLTVADVEATVDFYVRVLGMTPVTFGGGRRALTFGRQKLNLHQAGRELSPHARRPTGGSADLCFITSTPIEHVVTHLETAGVSVEDGPVDRTGAVGPLRSVYIRDPDGNLLEVANHLPAR